MHRNINLYPNLSNYVNGDQFNSGEMNGGQTNGDQLNSSQSVTGDMNGDQINSGQMNGGQTNGVQLISNQSVGGQMNRDQFNSGQMNGGQTNGCQLKNSQSVGHQMNGNQINSGQMNGGQMNGGQLINSQQVGDHMVGDQRNIGRMNGNQTNGGQLSNSQNVGGHLKGDQINSGQMNGGQDIEEQRRFRWSRGQKTDLKIEHSKKYENWMSELDSRFTEVAEPLKVWWFSIKARRNFLGHSANTKYGAYLIFRTKQDSEGLDVIQKAMISLGRKELTKYVYIKPPTATRGAGLPVERPDGWMELELGQFECDYGTSDKDAVISIEETKTDNKKTGLIVAGIEIRPI